MTTDDTALEAQRAKVRALVGACSAAKRRLQQLATCVMDAALLDQLDRVLDKACADDEPLPRADINDAGGGPVASAQPRRDESTPAPAFVWSHGEGVLSSTPPTTVRRPATSLMTPSQSWTVYDAEHGHASAAPGDIRAEIAALAERWVTEASPPGRSYMERKSRSPHQEGCEDTLDRCSSELLALLGPAASPVPEPGPAAFTEGVRQLDEKRYAPRLYVDKHVFVGNEAKESRIPWGDELWEIAWMLDPEGMWHPTVVIDGIPVSITVHRHIGIGPVMAEWGPRVPRPETPAPKETT